jgi:predicted nuclease of predicted toxin-antitoxin system
LVRFLTDENVPSSVSQWLKAHGHRVQLVTEVLHPGASDSLVASYSRRRGWTVVTLDQDFVRLHRQLSRPPGAIIIRIHPPTPDRIIMLLARLFEEVKKVRPGELVVIADNEIRIERKGT